MRNKLHGKRHIGSSNIMLLNSVTVIINASNCKDFIVGVRAATRASRRTMCSFESRNVRLNLDKRCAYRERRTGMHKLKHQAQAYKIKTAERRKIARKSHSRTAGTARLSEAAALCLARYLDGCVLSIICNISICERQSMKSKLLHFRRQTKTEFSRVARYVLKCQCACNNVHVKLARDGISSRRACSCAWNESGHVDSTRVCSFSHRSLNCWARKPLNCSRIEPLLICMKFVRRMTLS